MLKFNNDHNKELTDKLMEKAQEIRQLILDSGIEDNNFLRFDVSYFGKKHGLHAEVNHIDPFDEGNERKYVYCTENENGVRTDFIEKHNKLASYRMND